MDAFEQKSLLEAVLYILKRTGGIGYYQVFKILYFAEKNHLAKWGSSMIPDRFCALENGPVPTFLYDALRGHGRRECPELQNLLKEGVQNGSDDAAYILTARRDPDMNYLSKSEIEELDRSIAENSSLSFAELKDKSHDSAWNKAYYSKHSGRKYMDPVLMAKAADADKSTIAYLKDSLELQSACAR